MQLDFASMAILIAINLAVIGVALPLAMGTPISRAAQHMQGYFLLQALGWALILAASRIRGTTWDPIFSIAATCAASAAQWLMAQTLQSWLGPHSLSRLVLGLCVLGPLGFIFFIDSMTQRMAWYSLCHGLSIACLGWMCLRPQRPAAPHWRYLMAGCALVMSCSLFTRAYLAAYTPWLSGFAQDGVANHVFAVIAQVCGSLVLVCMLVAWRDETNQKLRELALNDQLTGLANRHALLQAAPLMQALAKRQQLPLAVLLLDIDHFKAVNDQHGHSVGDQALQLLARVLKSEVRSDEMAARWGGEEFCLLLYAQPTAVDAFYQRLCVMLQQQSLQELGFALHLSGGCALQSLQQPQSLQQLLQHADTALYEAKSNGRGRLVFERTSIAPALAPARAAQEPSPTP